MRHSRHGVAIGAALAVTVLVSACSSGSKSSSGGSNAGAGSPGPTANAGPATTIANDKPFKVMVAGDFTSTQLAFANPEIVAASKAVLNNVDNVTVVTCDSKGTAGDATSCERQAVSDGVAAVIVGFGNIGQDQDILTKAGIPTIGDTSTISPTAFSLANGLPLYTGIGTGLVAAGCKRIGTLMLDGTGVLADSIKKGVEVAGGVEAARSAIPANAPDLAPAIAKLRDKNADCVALSVVPTQVVQAVTAINQSGTPLKEAAVSAILTPDVIKSLGPTANGMIAIDATLDGGDTTSPAIVQMRHDMKAVDSKAVPSQLAAVAWASAKLIVDALPSVQGPVTPASMLAALNGLRNASTDGVMPPFSAIELPNPAYKRAFNHFGINYVITDGKLKREGDFYDLAPALK
jgi:hypothetical protein